MKRPVSDYPWDRIATVSRPEVGSARRIRNALGDALGVGALTNALASIVGAGVRVVLRDVSSGAPPPDETRSVRIAAIDSSIDIRIEPDAALTSALLGHILDRPAPVTDPEAALTDSVSGALTAISIEVMRRAKCATELVVPSGPPPRASGVAVRATLFLDGSPYGLTAWAAEGASPALSPLREPTVADLGDAPVSVPLVVAESGASRREAFDLLPGDVWMPGAGWFTKPEGGVDPTSAARMLLGRAVLAAPASERGVEVGHSEDGKIVLLGTVVALAADTEDPHRGSADRPMSEQKATLDSAILDSPVVVRIEIGTVSLTAREWAALRPGDVIETGLRLAESVALRIGGREVARGELVNVDGELGVRIRELVEPGRSP